MLARFRLSIRCLSLSLVFALVTATVLPSITRAQEGQPPAAPSKVQAEAITSEGRPSTRLSWIDTADNEVGFRVLDLSSPQQYDQRDATGTGSTVSIILPFASCFRVYAHNTYGQSASSDVTCSGEVTQLGTIRRIPENTASICMQGTYELVDPTSGNVTHNLTSTLVDLQQYNGKMWRVTGTVGEEVTGCPPLLTVVRVSFYISLQLPQEREWFEPNEERYNNYCGPGATQVALDARLPANQVADIDTLGKEQHVNESIPGVLANDVVVVLNRRLNTTWYKIGKAEDLPVLEAGIARNLNAGYAMLTGVSTEGMPGWGNHVTNHIVAVIGFYRTGDGTPYVGYIETAAPRAGYNGPRLQIVPLNQFWSYVQGNPVQMW